MAPFEPQRVLAIDWSGAKSGARRKIWLCEVADGEVKRLENGRSRDEIGELLLEEARRAPAFVAGLDFAFSFPEGFLRKRAHRSIDSVWVEASRLGEQWLEHCPFPFWGKPGRKKPALGEALYRLTEFEAAAIAGRRPMSVFQIGGAGVVGVGSIRGMPILSRLRAGGFSIWPFDEPKLPMVVEIWPRLFTGPVTKSRASERLSYLRAEHRGLPPEHLAAATESDDAFDALVSALAMDRHRDRFARLDPALEGAARIEGSIWAPEG